MESAGKRHIRLNVENACASAPSSLKTWLTSQTRRHYHRPTRSSRFPPPCSFRRSAVATAATRTRARSADGVSHPRRDDSRPSARRNTNRQRTPERVRYRCTPSPAAPVLLLPRISCCHIVQNVHESGRIGRNGRSGCCHGDGCFQGKQKPRWSNGVRSSIQVAAARARVGSDDEGPANAGLSSLSRRLERCCPAPRDESRRP
jgi:hypothetical protein